jgi:hypothetical protein
VRILPRVFCNLFSVFFPWFLSVFSVLFLLAMLYHLPHLAATLSPGTLPFATVNAAELDGKLRVDGSAAASLQIPAFASTIGAAASEAAEAASVAAAGSSSSSQQAAAGPQLISNEILKQMRGIFGYGSARSRCAAFARKF